MGLFSWFSRRKKIVLHQRGSYHDLATIYAKVNAEYFEGKLHLPFSWFGRRVRPRSRFRFGYYNLRTNHVRVHRMLDHPEVPEYCVAFILYHEMLHHILPPLKGKRGRRQIHHRAFTAKEKEFRDYALAQEFLDTHIVKSRKK